VEASIEKNENGVITRVDTNESSLCALMERVDKKVMSDTEAYSRILWTARWTCTEPILLNSPNMDRRSISREG